MNTTTYIEKEVSNEQKEIFDILSNAIVKIEISKNTFLPFTKCEIKQIKSKKSTVFSYILFVDDVPLTGKCRNYIIYYKCRCGRINSNLLQKYVHKMVLRCNHCAQDKNYGECGHNNPTYIVDKKYNDKTRYNYIYENESEHFKENYDKNHLTTEEFNKWLPHFQCINDIQLNHTVDTIKYIHHEVCNNQSHYTSKVIINGKKHTLKNVSLKCSICNKIHKVHINNLKYKDVNNIKCGGCALCNTTFPIRLYKNTNLTYQSSIEKEFLDLCMLHNIKVVNGLNIPYQFNGKNKTYISDYYLPEYNYIIELKSNNVYYRMQKKSGKLDAKNTAANNYAIANNMKFIFLFDNMIKDFIYSLINT